MANSTQNLLSDAVSALEEQEFDAALDHLDQLLGRDLVFQDLVEKLAASVAEVVETGSVGKKRYVGRLRKQLQAEAKVFTPGKAKKAKEKAPEKRGANKEQEAEYDAESHQLAKEAKKAAKEEEKRQRELEANPPSILWSVGDPVRLKFRSDREEYGCDEGVITAINDYSGVVSVDLEAGGFDFWFGDLTKSRTPNLCLCGCGTRVKGRFAQGHDQRVKGYVSRAIDEDGVFHLSVVQDEVQAQVELGGRDAGFVELATDYAEAWGYEWTKVRKA